MAKYFPFKSVDLCLDCWEEKHHRLLHTFRKELNYYNNYNPKQAKHGEAHNNISVSWCPYCYSSRVEKKGIRNGKQRCYCKNCGKNWTFEIPLDNNQKGTKNESDILNHQEYKYDKYPPINDKNSLSEKILQYLKNNPGEKAKTIASDLGADKKQINFLLYVKLRGKCIAKNYCWYPKEQLNEKNTDNFTREFDVETIKTYIKNKKANNKPIVFYYRNDSFPRIFHEYFLDGKYIKVRTDEGYHLTFLIDKIKKLE